MSKKPRIGELKTLIRIEMETEGYDDGRGNWFPGEWVTVVECWAKVQALKGSETVIAARLAHRQPFVVHVRADPALNDMGHWWRIKRVDKGDVLDIKSFIADDGAEFVEILCEAVT